MGVKKLWPTIALGVPYAKYSSTLGQVPYQLLLPGASPTVRIQATWPPQHRWWIQWWSWATASVPTHVATWWFNLMVDCSCWGGMNSYSLVAAGIVGCRLPTAAANDVAVVDLPTVCCISSLSILRNIATASYSNIGMMDTTCWIIKSNYVSSS